MRPQRNPKIVSFGPSGAMEAAAGVSANPAFMEDIQIAMASAPDLMRELGITVDDLPNAEIGSGYYARAMRLPNGLILKLTTDRDDAEAAAIIRDAGPVPGLVQVQDVWRIEKTVPAVDVADDGSWFRVPGAEPLYAIIAEPLTPLAGRAGLYKGVKGVFAAAEAGRVLYKLARKYKEGLPELLHSYSSVEEFLDAEGLYLSTPEAERYFDEVLSGWLWLSQRGYDVVDLHARNFGLGVGDRLVMFDFGHMSARDVGTSEIPLAANPSAKIDRVFDKTFDRIDAAFPDFGTVEFHEDEAAASDNGAGSERQFAYCKDGSPIVIAFAPKADRLPESHLRGLMRHEFGHALEYRYGVKELERRLGRRLPEQVERRADVIAEAVWGEPIVYDANLVQCVGVNGMSPRPRHLPDAMEKLKANGEVRYRILDRGSSGFLVKAYDGRKPIGLIGVFAPDATGWARVAKITVEPEYQRRGIGTELYRRGSDEACARGGNGLRSSEYSRSPAASRTWERVDGAVSTGEGHELPCALEANYGGPRWRFEGVDSLIYALDEAEPDYSHVNVSNEGGAYSGRRVKWAPGNYVVEVPVERVLFMEGNIWNPGHAAALKELITSGERPVFDLPAARLHRIDEDDVEETQRQHEEDELLYDRGMEEPWDDRDAGTFYVQLLDGNHRALAAMAAGEDSIFVTVGPSYREDVRDEEWVQ